jgi:hypothetical protein
LGIEKIPQAQQSGDGNAWLGFLAQEATGVGIEHPSRNGQDRPVRKLDDVTLLAPAAKPPYEMALVIEKGMMPVTDSHRRR